MEKFDIVCGSELISSLTLSIEKRTTMSKLFKAMPLLCCTNQVEVRSLAEEHALAVGVDPSGTVDYILAASRITYENIEVMILRSKMCSVWMIRQICLRFSETS